MRRSYRPRRVRQRIFAAQAASIADRASDQVWRRGGDWIQEWLNTYDAAVWELGGGHVGCST